METIGSGTKIEHERYGEGIVGEVNLSTYTIYFARGGKMDISKSSDELDIVTAVEGDEPQLSLSQVEEAITYVLDKHGALNSDVEMGEKWVEGTLTLNPGTEGMQNKEIPIETFFHKIVMVRDRLRVLEQNINSHAKLNDEEKVHLQQYITKAYGSLTTFNVLFKEKDDHFIGAKK